MDFQNIKCQKKNLIIKLLCSFLILIIAFSTPAQIIYGNSLTDGPTKSGFDGGVRPKTLVIGISNSILQNIIGGNQLIFSYKPSYSDRFHELEEHSGLTPEPLQTFTIEASNTYTLVANYINTTSNTMEKITVDINVSANGVVSVNNTNFSLIENYDAYYLKLVSVPTGTRSVEPVTLNINDTQFAKDNMPFYYFRMLDTDGSFIPYKISSFYDDTITAYLPNDAKEYEYRIHSTSILPATGSMKIDSGGTNFEVINPENHGASTSNIPPNISLDLKTSDNLFLVKNLPIGANLNIHISDENIANGGKIFQAFVSENQGFDVDFGSNETLDIKFSITSSTHLNIEFHSTIEKNDNTIVFSDTNYLDKNTIMYQYKPPTSGTARYVSIQLIPIIDIVQTSNTEGKAVLQDISRLFMNESYEPGSFSKGKFIIRNNTKLGLSIDSIGFGSNDFAFSFIPRERNNAIIAAASTSNLYKIEDYYNPPNTNGLSYYNYITQFYKKIYEKDNLPKSDFTLTDLDVKTMREYFSYSNPPNTFSLDEVQRINADMGLVHYLDNRKEFIILESDPNLRKFTEDYFLDNCLFFTLDAKMLPIRASGVYNKDLSLKAYMDERPENKEYFNTVLKGYTFPAGDSILLENVQWHLHGSNTTNSFQNNDFIFGMNIKLSYDPDVPGEIPDPSSSSTPTPSTSVPVPTVSPSASYPSPSSSYSSYTYSGSSRTSSTSSGTTSRPSDLSTSSKTSISTAIPQTGNSSPISIVFTVLAALFTAAFINYGSRFLDFLTNIIDKIVK